MSKFINLLGAQAIRQNLLSFSVYKNILPNPDKIIQKSYGDVSIYDDLQSDAHIKSCIQSRFAPTLSKEIRITGGIQEHVDFVKMIFSKLNLRRIVEEGLEANLYGYKPMEIYWRIVDGWLIPADVVGKPSWWFHFDNNNLLRFKTADNHDGELVDNQKFICVRNEYTYDNPYGVSILNPCYWPYVFKKGGIEFWVQFTEKYGIPWVVAVLKSATNVSEDAKDNILDSLDELIQDGTAALTSGLDDEVDVHIKEATKTSSVDVFKSLVHFMNAEISKAILSQTLTTEQGDTGSYAMSQTHLQVRNDIVEADSYMIEDMLLNVLIKYIIQLNFGDQSEYPKARLYEESNVNTTRAERDHKLIESGIIKQFTNKYIQKNYDLNNDDYILGTGKPESQPTFSEAPDNALEDLEEMGIKEFIKGSEKMMQPVLKLINDGKSYDEILEKLPGMYPDLNTDDIEKLISTAIITANFSGRVNA
jgi:phage gp29-like protein